VLSRKPKATLRREFTLQQHPPRQPGPLRIGKAPRANGKLNRANRPWDIILFLRTAACAPAFEELMEVRGCPDLPAAELPSGVRRQILEEFVRRCGSSENVARLWTQMSKHYGVWFELAKNNHGFVRLYAR
jgi:hypothetical protein